MNIAKLTYNPKKHTIYKPLNEEKYNNNDPIICKSKWEYDFCVWCDKNPSVIQWSSETLQIQYFDPVKKKNRRYFPDFTIKIKDINNNITTYVIEIKPEKETKPPILKNGKKDKTYLYEFCTYQTNVAKWKAALIFCRKYGVIFRILTERDLYKNV